LPVYRFQALRDIVMGRRPELYVAVARPKSMNLLLDQVRSHWLSDDGVARDNGYRRTLTMDSDVPSSHGGGGVASPSEDTIVELKVPTFAKSGWESRDVVTSRSQCEHGGFSSPHKEIVEEGWHTERRVLASSCQLGGTIDRS